MSRAVEQSSRSLCQLHAYDILRKGYGRDVGDSLISPLVLQAELLQQVAVNRPRLLAVLEKAAADVPARQLEADKRTRSEEYVTAFFNVRPSETTNC